MYLKKMQHIITPEISIINYATELVMLVSTVSYNVEEKVGFDRQYQSTSSSNHELLD
jgi:hypothetical protein